MAIDPRTLYDSLNNAYYNSSYNQSLGQQGKAKGFWDWVQDPNRENYNASDYSTAQSLFNPTISSLGLSSGNVNPPSSLITNTPTPNTTSPIAGTTSVGPVTTATTTSPISGNITPQSLAPSNVPAAPAPITASNANVSMPTVADAISQKRLATFGAIQ